MQVQQPPRHGKAVCFTFLSLIPINMYILRLPQLASRCLHQRLDSTLQAQKGSLSLVPSPDPEPSQHSEFSVVVGGCYELILRYLEVKGCFNGYWSRGVSILPHDLPSPTPFSFSSHMAVASEHASAEPPSYGIKSKSELTVYLSPSLTRLWGLPPGRSLDVCPDRD